MASDVEEYFNVIQIARRRQSRDSRRSCHSNRDHRVPGDYLTNFERKYRIEGRPIHYAYYLLK